MTQSPLDRRHRSMGWAVLLTLLILVAEAVGGLWTRSLALLSDAAHVFFDLFALLLSYGALRLAERPANDRYTFGFQRAEAIAALVNGLTLFCIAGFILFKAVQRLTNPADVRTLEMLVIATVGLVVNLVVAFLLHEHQHDSLNVHSAFLHVVGDALSSGAIILGGLVMWRTGWYALDAILSMGIAGLLFTGTMRVLRESVHLLIEGVPAGIHLPDVVQTMSAVPGIRDVHDLHIWSIGQDRIALSAHVWVYDGTPESRDRLLEVLRERLRDEFQIHHVTVQLENGNCGQGRVMTIHEEPKAASRM